MACLFALGFWQVGATANIPSKAWLAQEFMQRAWSKAKAPAHRPWKETRPVARLRAKGGDVDLIVLEGSSEQTLAYGPGHMRASASPGEQGNSIIAGHRDTHFQFLRDLEAGDAIMIDTVAGATHIYRVTGIDVLHSRRGHLLLDTDAHRLSLVTCYPFGESGNCGPMRYVVTAEKLYSGL